MKNLRPIFWQQGLFLQPQHFQLSDLYYQSLVAPLARFNNPFFWGVNRLKISENALREKSLVVEEAEIMFPDGTCLESPGNAIIQARSFEDDWVEGGGRFRVFLGLKNWDQYAENVTVVSSLDGVAGVTTRFVTTADPEEVADLYYAGPAAQVKRLHYLPKLFWETEKDQLAKYHLLPIAELEQEGDEIKLSADFIPPVLQVESSAQLLALLKGIHDKVSARCRRLEEYKSPRAMQSAQLEPGVFFLLMGLRAITGYVPWLVHLTENPGVHPLAVYETLIQLCGELSIFSKTLGASGKGADGQRLIPPYDHQNLARCFIGLGELIGRLLDEITFGPESVIRLEYREPYFTGEMENRVFSDRNVYYLSLQTEKESAAVVDTMTHLAKLSARENLPILTSRALPGLKLDHVPIPPPGLPQISSTTYFRIDVLSAQWDDVQRLNNIALNWDGAPEDLVAEIIVLRRS